MTRAVDNRVITPGRTEIPIVINGDMAIWQRGPALSSDSGNYACDRFWYAGTGATSQRSTDVPSGFVYSNKLTYGSADMSIGQPIELPATGKQGDLISGQTLTLAFYGKVDSGTEGIGTAINFRNSKFSSTDQQAFTISDSGVTLTTDWQRFTKTFTIPTVHANNIMAAFEINGISKTAYITGVQVEVGDFNATTLPPFQFEAVGTSLVRCQRYFQKSYQQSDVPGTATQLGSVWHEIGDSTSDFLSFSYNTQIEMRSSASVTTFDLAGTSAKVSYSGSVNGKSGTIANASPKGWRIHTDNSTSKDALVYQFTASAEL